MARRQINVRLAGDGARDAARLQAIVDHLERERDARVSQSDAIRAAMRFFVESHSLEPAEANPEKAPPSP